MIVQDPKGGKPLGTMSLTPFFFSFEVFPKHLKENSAYKRRVAIELVPKDRELPPLPMPIAAHSFIRECIMAIVSNYPINESELRKYIEISSHLK